MANGEADILKHKLNYITAVGWSCDIPGHDADKFYNEQKAMINRTMLRLGYRISLQKGLMPKVLQSGKEFYLKQVWRNEGVGRFYGDYNLKISLLNKEKAVSWEVEDKSLKLTDAVNGKSDVNHRSVWTLPQGIPTGLYQVKFSLVSRKNANLQIKLAHPDRDELGRYLLGTIELIN